MSDGAKVNAADSAVLEALLKNSKKQVFYARIAAVFTGALFIAVAIALVIVIPRLSETLSMANAAITDAQSTLKDIDGMSASLTRTSDGLNDLLTDNANTLTESVEKLSSIDFEGINTAIGDLQDAIGPLAESMRSLSQFSLFR